MKPYFFLILLILGPFISLSQTKTFYDFSARTIDGEEFDFSVLRGKKVMIVNTASTCSLTPQYKRLQELYEEYGGDDFEIVAFPANNFFNREPGTNAEIKEFCDKKYGITFRLMEKISVKGDSIHPVYRWLTSSKENGMLDAPVKWNFQKFLINPDGTIKDVVEPWTRPDIEKVVEWILSEN
jgi:glutathione peroxidase